MKRRTLITSAVALATIQWARCEEFLTPAQAGALFFPGQKLRPQVVALTPDQKKEITKSSGVRVRGDAIHAWRNAGGDWLICDNVIGKHEYIDFAVGLSKAGSVLGVEIMTYRETYGDQVRLPKWREQFSGKRVAEQIKIDADIKNISGATLSCVHVTEGVRRLLHTHALVLKNLDPS